MQGETGGNKTVIIPVLFAAQCGWCDPAQIHGDPRQAAFSACQITLIRRRMVLSSGDEPCSELESKDRAPRSPARDNWVHHCPISGSAALLAEKLRFSKLTLIKKT